MWWKKINLASSENFSTFKDIIPNEIRKSIVESISWIKFDGTLYKANFIICIGRERTLPLFGKIYKLIKSHGTVYFLVEKMHTKNFNEDIRAYTVEKTNNWKFITKKDLETHVTCCCQILPSGVVVVPQICNWFFTTQTVKSIIKFPDLSTFTTHLSTLEINSHKINSKPGPTKCMHLNLYQDIIKQEIITPNNNNYYYRNESPIVLHNNLENEVRKN